MSIATPDPGAVRSDADADAPLSLTLTDPERREFDAVAQQLATTTPELIDDAKWVAAARELSAHLPPRLRQVVRAYRHDPGEDGTLLLRNLPVDPEVLPTTPTVPESVEREATVPAAVAVLIAAELGEIAAYRNEKSGALVQNVVPVPGRESSQSNAGSTPLELHVENAFHPHRPDFVGLLCLRADPDNAAGTLVSSFRRTLRLLDPATREVLHQERFTTVPPPSFRSGDSAVAHAVLTGDPEDPNVKVDFNATAAVDTEAAAALERLRDAFVEASTSVPLRSGEMVFVDNRLAIHGRSAFTPRYDGQDRWLHRTFVLLDNRRTRGSRPGNGSVLD
ncbi:TauD/TfdA family dioxygenase [Streptomyces sp. BA2]|uniref:TauD/TfdA family dioxygenase n=1 Tax=Streptomyces sp. BA2 TaxID=436595 RepID=UPI00132A59D1|nr:TauD/TfdA family dioxygenase [Streptomyces sp. BA2]MWA14446.1 clavaminate synthase [Streptomyces sp. BA2]